MASRDLTVSSTFPKSVEFVEGRSMIVNDNNQYIEVEGKCNELYDLNESFREYLKMPLEFSRN